MKRPLYFAMLGMTTLFFYSSGYAALESTKLYPSYQLTITDPRGSICSTTLTLNTINSGTNSTNQYVSAQFDQGKPSCAQSDWPKDVNKITGFLDVYTHSNTINSDTKADLALNDDGGGAAYLGTATTGQVTVNQEKNILESAQFSPEAWQNFFPGWIFEIHNN